MCEVRRERALGSAAQRSATLPRACLSLSVLPACLPNGHPNSWRTDLAGHPTTHTPLHLHQSVLLALHLSRTSYLYQGRGSFYFPMSTHTGLAGWLITGSYYVTRGHLVPYRPHQAILIKLFRLHSQWTEI